MKQRKNTIGKSVRLSSSSAIAACLFLLPASLGLSAQAAPVQTSLSSAISAAAGQSITAVFKPNPSRKINIDYTAWSDILDNAVIYTGPSTRNMARRPSPVVGSRIITGHTSPFRMEGNKIPFSEFKDSHLEVLTEYRADLVRIANEYDVTTFPLNEQLAFWLNLHNVLVIEHIAEAYPVKVPSEIEIGPEKTLLADAKLVNINGNALSLRDIREKIVFAHWNDPAIAYGFFLGDIGSPSISTSAFTAENVYDKLDFNAREFVNSLRGYRSEKDNVRVSELYRNWQRFFYPNFKNDLTSHFSKYMDPEVFADYKAAQGLNFSKYESVIADITGGRYDRIATGPVLVDGKPYGGQETGRFLRELTSKKETLKDQGKIGGGRVIIIDLDTSAAPEPPESTENTP